MKKNFLKWWLIVCLISVGICFMFYFGMFQRINAGDVTKLSFAIFALFIFFSIKIGFLTYHIDCVSRYQLRTTEWFSDKFVTLGMIGTVLGFLYTLSSCFSKIDTSNAASMQAVISSMAIGMSTALYTTAAGLICSFLLKLQIYNVYMGLPSCETQAS
jgi:hypothetical protein